MAVGAECTHPKLLQLGPVRRRIGIDERKIDFRTGVNTLLAKLFLFLTQYSWHAMHGKESSRLHIRIFGQIKGPKFLHLVSANSIAGNRLNFEYLEIEWPRFICDNMKLRETIRD